MGDVTHPDRTILVAEEEIQSSTWRLPIIGSIIWVIDLFLLIASSLFFHLHQGPLPGELAFSKAVQSFHFEPWFFDFLTFVSLLNDIPPSAVALVLWVVGLCLFRKFRPAIFLALVVGVGNTINALLADFVGRPRPSPHLIHVTTRLVFNSFPSGHTEHDTVYYGFLLYLSFTKSVREWRYYQFLLPLQIFAVIILLSIGFSRVYEGEHWLADVLAGYLSGALWLSIFIFLYGRVGKRWAKER